MPRKRTSKREPAPTLIDPKDAVKLAVAYVTDIYKDSATVADVLLEEIEADENGTSWHVTVSFRLTNVPEPPQSGGFTAALLKVYTPQHRKYKVVDVDGQTGRIRSMKIRDVPRGDA